MDLTRRSASLDGIPGAVLGATEEGTVWQGALEPERCSSLLRASASGRAVELCSEGGRSRALVRRCWVDVDDGQLTLRVLLELRASA